MNETNNKLTRKHLYSDNQEEIFHMAQSFKQNGNMFQYIDNEAYNGMFFHINDKKLLNFASCSYMGLETHPDIISASIDAIKKYGTQTSNSRATFSIALYKMIEELLPEIFPGYHVISKTVTLGHFSVLPLLVQEKDAIILDAFAHNSIRMAAQNCKANGSMIILARHNDMEHVKYLTKRLKKDGYQNIWFCADSIYSMHGDFIDIKGLQKLLNEEDNLYSYIDDAHGTGWYGDKGCGYVFQNMEIHSKMIVIESFAKSFASCGGLIIAKEKELSDIIRMTGQTMLFSGPLQPAVLGAIIGSIKVHLSLDFRIMQNELLKLIIYFKEKSKELSIPIVSKDVSPIQLVKIGNVEKTLHALEKLLEYGFYATSAVYPAVSEEDSGIRISITRHLKIEDIDNLLNHVKKILCNIC